MRETGFRVEAATITPEGAEDVGSPNRILREEIDGKVIIRIGRRIPGVTPIARVHFPIPVVRMAVDDAYGAPQWREGSGPDEVAHRTEKITRSTCHPDTPHVPVLIDANYAGLISGAADTPLVIPALNRDGDCLSDLVLPMFGSIAGAESVLLAFDADYATQVAVAEVRTGPRRALRHQPRQPDGHARGLRGDPPPRRPGRPSGGRDRLARDLTIRARGHGVRHSHARSRRSGIDHGRHADVCRGVATKPEVWSALGTDA